MAKKFSEFSADTELTGEEILLISQGGTETLRTSVNAVKDFVTSGLRQGITASTNPTVSFKSYPVSGAISKGQGVTLVSEDNVLKMKAITGSVSTIETGEKSFEGKSFMFNKTVQDSIGTTITVFNSASQSSAGSYFNVIKESDTKFYGIFYHGYVRVLDTYTPHTDGKPKTPSRVYSNSASGPTHPAICILGINVKTDNTLTFDDLYFYCPQLLKKVSTATTNFVDRQFMNTSLNTFVAYVISPGKIGIRFHMDSTPYYEDSAGFMTTTVPTSKAPIRSRSSWGSYGAAANFAIINIADREQYFAEYTNYYSNFFNIPPLLPGWNADGNSIVASSGSCCKISESRLFYSIQNYYGASGRVIRDDDGNRIDSGHGIYNILDITEGTETVDDTTINTFTMSKVKTIRANSTSYTNTRNCHVFNNFLYISTSRDSGVRLIFNASFDDFIRDFDSTNRNFTTKSQSAYIVGIADFRFYTSGYSGVRDLSDSIFGRYKTYYDGGEFGYSLNKFQGHVYATYDEGGRQITATSQDIYTGDSSENLSNWSHGNYDECHVDHKVFCGCFYRSSSQNWGVFFKNLAGANFRQENLNFDHMYGVSFDDYSDGDTGRLIFLKDSVTLDLYSGLIVGVTYYLTISGNITSDPITDGRANKLIGRAISTTEIATS